MKKKSGNAAAPAEVLGSRVRGSQERCGYTGLLCEKR